MPSPPVSLSAISNTAPPMSTTNSPSPTPSSPACHTAVRLMVNPRVSPRNGTSAGTAGARNLRIAGSRLPSAIPNASGRIAPTSACQGNADSPAIPRVTIVRNGPDSRLITL